MSTPSRAGIVRIFRRPFGRFAHSAPAPCRLPSPGGRFAPPPGAGKGMSPFLLLGLFVINRLGSSPFSLCSCKEKVEKRESTPGRGMFRFIPLPGPTPFSDSRRGPAGPLPWILPRGRGTKDGRRRTGDEGRGTGDESRGAKRKAAGISEQRSNKTPVESLLCGIWPFSSHRGGEIFKRG